MRNNIYVESPERQVTIRFGIDTVEIGVDAIQAPRYSDDNCWEGTVASIPKEKYDAGLEELKKIGECKIESRRDSLILKRNGDKVNFIGVSSGSGRYCSADSSSGVEIDINRF